MQPIDVGSLAPDFSLADPSGQPISLSGLYGAPVVLAFYPGDWSPVCSDQLELYSKLLPDFERYGAAILAISVDSQWCHGAFGEARHLRFPLLADFEPKGAVAQMYGVYRKRDGTAERALFVIDEQGTIVWKHTCELNVNPGADGILSALERLTSN